MRRAALARTRQRVAQPAGEAHAIGDQRQQRRARTRDRPVPSALTSTVFALQRPITFKVNLLSGGIDDLTTPILPAQADVPSPG